MNCIDFFSNIGWICLRYIFSMMSGTVNIIVGLISLRAFIKILGDGILPRYVVCEPQQKAVRKSNAHP